MVAAVRYPAIVSDKRTVRLRVIGGYVEIDDAVPRTRADCPATRDRAGHRRCGHVRCKWHLWRIDGVDNAGRRVNGRAPATTLRPVWLDWPLPPSCGADFADAAGERGEFTPIDVIAYANDVRKTALHQTLADALAKLRSLGVDLRRLMLRSDE